MVACRVLLLQRVDDDELDSRLMQALVVVLALLTLTSLGILVSRTLEMNGGDWLSLGHDVHTVLSQTHYGEVWIWRVPALILLWMVWLAALRYRGDWWTGWIMFAALAIIAMTRSDTGHAADAGDFVPLVWVDWLHLMAGGMWVGSLLGMALVVFPRWLDRGAAVQARAAEVFQRLSSLSGAALAVVLGAGIFMAVQQLEHVSDLWRTRYGVALDVKIVVVAGMIFIGAWNRYIRLPGLLRQAGMPTRDAMLGRLFRRAVGTPVPLAPARAGELVRSCARALLGESLLGLVVLAAAAVLLHAPPPSDMVHMH
ncbi:MAG TPA: CopD family protein, partial [Nevskiaceae bacterium]|nr:CopD family protein [Nevskiaceae bacterium]